MSLTVLLMRDKIPSHEMESFFILNDTIPPDSREEMRSYFFRIFGNNNPLVVEIGSGNGHFLVDYAMRYPHQNYVGTEILGGRARKFHSKIVKRRLHNIVIFKGDARRFLWEYLYENTTQEFIILFPDPWPKTRHHKHRLITAAFINMLRIRLVPDGLISIATDHVEYRDWIIDEFQKIDGFSNLYTNGYTRYPEHYPKTLFEKRFKNEGRKLFFIQVKKVGD